MMLRALPLHSGQQCVFYTRFYRKGDLNMKSKTIYGSYGFSHEHPPHIQPIIRPREKEDLEYDPSCVGPKDPVMVEKTEFLRILSIGSYPVLYWNTVFLVSNKILLYQTKRI